MSGPTATTGPVRFAAILRAFAVLVCTLVVGAGCRQKMAEAPYYRPYDESDFFKDGRSARPLERGTIHRGQYLETDPMMTGLTREEWGRIYAKEGDTFGAPRFDPANFDAAKYGGEAHAGPPIYVTEYPFEITKKDLDRGQERFTIYCAVCHGPLGNGQGKIWERGYLTPTSFHTEMVGDKEVKVEAPRDIPLGFSRGYGLWGIKIPMREVPIGYIFEVITKGYAGMPNYPAQISPEDRWRIIAYVRTLQLSRYSPTKGAEPVNAGGKK